MRNLRVFSVVVLALVVVSAASACFVGGATGDAVVTCVDGACPGGLVCVDVVARCLPADRAATPPLVTVIEPFATTPVAPGKTVSAVVDVDTALFASPVGSVVDPRGAAQAVPVVVDGPLDGPFTVAVTVPAGLADGPWQVALDAVDVDGDAAHVDVGGFVVDGTSPRLLRSSVQPALVNASGTIAVAVTFDEEVAIAAVRVDGVDVAFTVDDPTTPSAILVQAGALAAVVDDGAVELSATFADGAGNERTLALGSVVLDTTPPATLSTSLTPSSARAGVPFVASVVADEPVRATAARERDGVTRALAAESLGATASSTFSIDADDEGAWRVRFDLTDAAGNAASVDVGVVVVDVTAPPWSSAVVDGAVVLERAPFGRGADPAPVSQLRIDRSGFDVDVARVEAYIGGSTFLVGATDGDTLPLPPIDLTRVDVVAVDGVGNRSAPVDVDVGRLTVPLGAAVTSTTALPAFAPDGSGAAIAAERALVGPLALDGATVDVAGVALVASTSSTARPASATLAQGEDVVRVVSREGVFTASSSGWATTPGAGEVAGTLVVHDDRYRPCGTDGCTAQLTVLSTRETAFDPGIGDAYALRGGLLFGVEGPYFVPCFESAAGFTDCTGDLYTVLLQQAEAQAPIQVFVSKLPSEACTPDCHVPVATGGDMTASNAGLFLLSPDERRLFLTQFGGWSVVDEDAAAGVYDARSVRMAYDDDRGALVAVVQHDGGVTDAWEWSGTWARVDGAGGPTAPPSSAAFVRGQGVVVVDIDGVARAYDGARWRTLVQPEDPFPTRALDASLVYDDVDATLVFSPDAHGAPSVLVDGFFARRVAAPGEGGARFARTTAGPALFGDGAVDALRVFVGASGWSPAVDDGSAPGGRESAGLAPLDDTLVLFGGQPIGAPLDDTTWVRDASGHWTALAVPGPAPRFRHAMAADPPHHRVVVVGGMSDRERAGDVAGGPPLPVTFVDAWAFDGAAWTRLPDVPLSTNAGGDGVFDAGLVFDDDIGALVFIGGRRIVENADASQSEIASDVVAVLDGDTWRTIAVGGDGIWTSRDPRGAFDPRAHRFVLPPSTTTMATGAWTFARPTTPASTLAGFSLRDNTRPPAARLSWTLSSLLPARSQTAAVTIDVVAGGVHGGVAGAVLWRGATVTTSTASAAPSSLRTDGALAGATSFAVVVAAVDGGDGSRGPSRLTLDGAEATVTYRVRAP